MEEPVHVHIALAFDLAVLGVQVGQGGVFDETLVALVVAFHSHDDQLLFGFDHIVVHAPGFAIGGVLVEEHIVAVEHIHDGVAFIGVFVIGCGKINV